MSSTRVNAGMDDTTRAEHYKALAVKLWVVFSVAAILMFLEVALSVAVAA
jgi:hypothetical protein